MFVYRTVVAFALASVVDGSRLNIAESQLTSANRTNAALRYASEEVSRNTQVLIGLQIIKGTQSSCPEYYKRIEPLPHVRRRRFALNGDLNQGSGGAYLYLCGRWGAASAANPVTDVGVFSRGSSTNGCGDLPSGFNRISVGNGATGSTNMGTPIGRYVYICTREDRSESALTDIKLSQAPCEHPWVRTVGGGGSLNEGAAGRYIYICVKRDSVPQIKSSSACAKQIISSDHGSGHVKQRVLVKRGIETSSSYESEETKKIAMQAEAGYSNGLFSATLSSQVEMESMVKEASSETSVSHDETETTLECETPCYIYQAKVTHKLSDGGELVQWSSWKQTNRPMPSEFMCR